MVWISDAETRHETKLPAARQAPPTAAERAAERATLADAAQELIAADDVFAKVVATMASRGYAGDPSQVELLYAIFTSRLLPRPMCAFLKAPSSAGKSWLLNRTLELFPEEAYELKSGFSPKAIAYGNSDLRHRILVVQEASGLNGREGNMLVRTLVSEGQIRWEVAGRQRGGFATRTVVRPGPIAFGLTTTHASLHREDETRALSIQVDDSRTHTKEVIRSIARRYGGESAAVDLAPWHAFQRWLELGPRQVIVPFADALADAYWAAANRCKRDFEQLLTAIAVSTLLHQTRRATDPQGRLMATLDDYAHARRLLLKPLSEVSRSAVPPLVRLTVEILAAELAKASAPDAPPDTPQPTLHGLAKLLGVDASTVWRRLQTAKQLGFVVDLGRGDGAIFNYGVRPLPPECDTLPAVDHIRETMGGRAPDAPGRRAPEPEPVLSSGEEPLAEKRAARAAGELAAPAYDEPPGEATLDEGAHGEDPETAEPVPAERAAADADRAAALKEALAETDAPTLAPAPAPTKPLPPIIANAPNPGAPDGGYRARRAIYQFRAAREERNGG